MRGATSLVVCAKRAEIDFNPRSSCEERPGCPAHRRNAAISIHAPHARSDAPIPRRGHHPTEFQSTLLMRGATSVTTSWRLYALFQSTLLMRGATRHFNHPFLHLYFNPRSSCEERQDDCQHCLIGKLFQSTLLMRGATSCFRRRAFLLLFQSTLLMRGAT